MGITRRKFSSMLGKAVLFTLPITAPITLDEVITNWLSRAMNEDIKESDGDKHYNISSNLKEFEYDDGKKSIPIYVTDEQTFFKIRDSLEFFREKKPGEYDQILLNVVKMKEGRFKNKEVFMSVLPRLNIVYFNNEYVLSKEKIETGCAIYHETVHLEGHGEILAYFLSDICIR